MFRAEIDINRNPIEEMLSRIVDLRPAFQAWLDMRRELIKREFDRGLWLRPGGGEQFWEPTKAFGSRPAPARTMQRSGALLRALLGRHPGSIEVITENSAEFGVKGSAFPYATVHRGGAGKVGVAQARSPQTIQVTPKMRGFLAANFGVFLRKSTRVIRIPRRPFATESPESRTRRAAIFSRYVRGLALEAGRGAF